MTDRDEEAELLLLEVNLKKDWPTLKAVNTLRKVACIAVQIMHV